jgi:hypothetical protein
MEDDANTRFFHMKQRFGIDLTFPASRYTTGLSSSRVPDRNGEHPGPRSDYVGTADCTNPIFAASLPTGPDEELCKRPIGGRTQGLVFYAAITGVPPDLIPAAGAPDWSRVLGADPLRYDFTGADPRMRESIVSRALPEDRDTGGTDLQYACAFPIEAKTCAMGDPACDCSTPQYAGDLCDPTHPSTQVRAKAYPGIHHLALVKSLGNQGIALSICPTDTSNDSQSNPSYGYRPAVRTIVDRLKTALEQTCLPQKLDVAADGTAQCAVLETLPGANAGCDASLGLKVPDDDVLRSFTHQRADLGDDLSGVTVCQLSQLGQDRVKPCGSKENAPGWCYATGDEARTSTKGRCDDAILFSASGNPQSGTHVYLECLEAGQPVD